MNLVPYLFEVSHRKKSTKNFLLSCSQWALLFVILSSIQFQQHGTSSSLVNASLQNDQRNLQFVNNVHSKKCKTSNNNEICSEMTLKNPTHITYIVLKKRDENKRSTTTSVEEETTSTFYTTSTPKSTKNTNEKNIDKEDDSEEEENTDQETKDTNSTKTTKKKSNAKTSSKSANSLSTKTKSEEESENNDVRITIYLSDGNPDKDENKQTFFINKVLNTNRSAVAIAVDQDAKGVKIQLSKRLPYTVSFLYASERLTQYPFVRLVVEPSDSNNSVENFENAFRGLKNPKYYVKLPKNSKLYNFEMLPTEYESGVHVLREIQVELTSECSEKLSKMFRFDQKKQGKQVQLEPKARASVLEESQICRYVFDKSVEENFESGNTIRASIQTDSLTNLIIKDIRLMIKETPEKLNLKIDKSETSTNQTKSIFKGIDNILSDDGSLNQVVKSSQANFVELIFDLVKTEQVLDLRLTISEDNTNDIKPYKHFYVAIRNGNTSLQKIFKYFWKNNNNRTQQFPINFFADRLKLGITITKDYALFIQNVAVFGKPDEDPCLKIPRCNPSQTKFCIKNEKKKSTTTRTCECLKGFKHPVNSSVERQTCELDSPCAKGDNGGCKHGSHCVDFTDNQNVKCECPRKYKGRFCEILPMQCIGRQCGEYGNCRVKTDNTIECKCKQGYKKSSETRDICDVPESSYCKIPSKDKKHLTVDTESLQMNQKAVATCLKGYKFIHNNRLYTSLNITCEERYRHKGKVVPDWPNCKEIVGYCKFKNKTKEIEVEDSGVKLNDQIEVVCRDGQHIKEIQAKSTVIKCVEGDCNNGQQKQNGAIQDEPKCSLSPNYCTPSESKTYKFVSKKNLTIGSKIVYKCQHGYMIQTALKQQNTGKNGKNMKKDEENVRKYRDVRVCSANKKILPNPEPVCIKVQNYCSSSRYGLQHMNISARYVQLNERINYKCEKGYRIKNQTSLKTFASAICRQKNHKHGTLGIEPICEKIRNMCEIHANNKTSHFKFDKKQVGLNESTTLTCDEGYEFKASKNRSIETVDLKCGLHGQTPRQPVSCIEKRCRIKRDVNSHTIDDDEEENTLQKSRKHRSSKNSSVAHRQTACKNLLGSQQSCTLYCKKGYGINPAKDEVVKRWENIRCDKGKLDKENIRCTPLPCRELNVENSDDNCTYSEHDESCSFECNKGYEKKLSNTSDTVCKFGMWTNVPECVEKHCPNFTVSSEYLAPKCNKNRKHGAKCRAQCAKRYYLANKNSTDEEEANGVEIKCDHGSQINLPTCYKTKNEDEENNEKTSDRSYGPRGRKGTNSRLNPLAEKENRNSLKASNTSQIALEGGFQETGIHRFDFIYCDGPNVYTVIDATKLDLNKTLVLPHQEYCAHATFYFEVTKENLKKSILSLKHVDHEGSPTTKGKIYNVEMSTDDSHNHYKEFSKNVVCIGLQAIPIEPKSGFQHLAYKNKTSTSCGCAASINIKLDGKSSSNSTLQDDETENDQYKFRVAVYDTINEGSSTPKAKPSFQFNFKSTSEASNGDQGPILLIEEHQMLCQEFNGPAKIVFEQDDEDIVDLVKSIKFEYRGSQTTMNNRKGLEFYSTESTQK